MNIKNYLNRININQEIKPNLIDLKVLQKQHLLNIPFENFDIHSNKKIELNISKIHDKIINNNRGGFCYELNGLFYELLKEIGFDVKIISARVYSAGKYGPEYDHLAIIVSIDSKRYLVDVGFGAFSFHPLEFELGKKLIDEKGRFVFDKYDDDYFKINKITNGELIPEYIFKDEEPDFQDFKDMCHFHQSSEESHFSKKKFISIPTEEGRITLSNNQLKITRGELITEREVASEEVKELLVKYFKQK